jgi:hypothetical protein
MNATGTACDPLISFQCLVSSGYNHHPLQKEMSFLADLPPPQNAAFESPLEQQAHYAWVDSVLEEYWNPNDGFFVIKEHRALTYGEVTSLGCRHLAHHMKISSISSPQDLVFLDIGSGVGKLATQMYLDNQQSPNFRQSIGVELSQKRHEIGTRALADLLLQEEQNLQMPLQENDIPILLVHGDAIEYLDNILSKSNTSNITHVYISSLCFPKAVRFQLQERLLRFAPSLQVVAALNRLDAFAFHKEWKERRDVPIQMSWGPSMVHVYERLLIEEKYVDWN